MKKDIRWIGPYDKPGEWDMIKASLEEFFPDHEAFPRFYAQSAVRSHIDDAITSGECDIIAAPEDRVITVEDLRFAKANNIRLIRMRRNITSTIFIVDKSSGEASLQYNKDRIEWQYVDRVVERTHGTSQITVEINGSMVKHQKRAK